MNQFHVYEVIYPFLKAACVIHCYKCYNYFNYTACGIIFYNRTRLYFDNNDFETFE